MDAGGDRPFAERAELDGEGPACSYRSPSPRRALRARAAASSRSVTPLLEAVVLRFVAVAADFYNPEGEGWRVVYPARSGKKPIELRLGQRQLSIR